MITSRESTSNTSNIRTLYFRKRGKAVFRKMSQQQIKKVIHLPKVRMLGQGRLSSGLKVTNVKSIKLSELGSARKQAAERLKLQLQKEIARLSRTCGNKNYECLLPVISGRNYCARHILQDPTAPYQQCAYSYSNGDRCKESTPSFHYDRRDRLCFEHARMALADRQRRIAQAPPVVSSESLLNQLQHYVSPERTRTTSCNSSVSIMSDPAPEPTLPYAVDPFKQMDAVAINSSLSANLMACASAHESDADSVTLGVDGDSREAVWSDVEPVEAGPLDRAGIYAAEEALGEVKNVFKKLQTAYISQKNRLRQMLHTARATYVKTLRTERDQACSIKSQIRRGLISIKDRRKVRKLKAFAGYHVKHGIDAMLARKRYRKRVKANDVASNRPIPSQGRCTFAEGGVRCASAVLPASKHCLKHVIHDRQQVLFVPCGDMRGGVMCREPVPKLPTPSMNCRYHTNPPVYTTFALKKDGSESESRSTSVSDDYPYEDYQDHNGDERSDAVSDNAMPMEDD